MIALLVASGSVFLPSIIPKPMRMEATEGAFVIPTSLSILADAEARPAVDALVRLIRPSGMTIKTARSEGDLPTTGKIVFHIDPSLDALGAEGYRLDVRPDGVEMRAPKPAGLFYAVQSLRQMLPPELERGRRYDLPGDRIQCVSIEDKPRFSWRGMHLDESRHFFGVDAVKRYIDTLALHKMNVFHWHLVDDGGWRIEIKKYPLLTEVGAWRKGTGKGWNYIDIDFKRPEPVVSSGSGEITFGPGGKVDFGFEAQGPGPRGAPVYGGFYTQAEIRDIVRYAQSRFVTIVPEIEMPGHALPAPFCYHEVGCDPVSIEAWQKATGMRYGNVYCAGKEETFTFIQNVLDEVVALFPSPFLHIGGDEVDKRLWKECPTCQARMQAEGLKDEHELQSYFVKRVETYLNTKGKRLIGWDEILEGGLAPNATVMSWRGISGGIEAAKAGHDVVMSPTSHCYYDYPYSSISTELVYSYDPIPEELDPAQGQHVLGAQGNVWTEWMEDYARVETMAFPRASALAEVVWSPKEGRRWIEFEGRLRDHYRRLAEMGVHFNVPAPTAKLDAIVFRTSASVEFERAPLAGGEVRYTLDGSTPTARSAVYEGPIEVRSNTVVKAATFFRGIGSQPIAVTCVKAGASVSADSKMSVQVKLGKFSTCAEVEQAASAKTLEVDGFGIDVAGVEDGFGLVFTKALTIDAAGVYTFSTTSDDGSTLSIGGALVVDNDGLHGAVTKSGRVWLESGVYAMKVVFFEQGGAQSLVVTGPTR